MSVLDAGERVEVKVALEVLLCAACSMPFSVPADFIRRRREDGKPLHCPSGHTNYWPDQEQRMAALVKERGELQSRVEALQVKVRDLEAKLEVSRKASLARGERGHPSRLVMEELVKVGKPVHYAEVARPLGMSRVTVGSIFRRLLVRGKVVRTRMGWYELVPT